MGMKKELWGAVFGVCEEIDKPLSRLLSVSDPQYGSSKICEMLLQPTKP